MNIKNKFYKQAYNIFTLKSLFQIIDLLFKYFVIKTLSVADVGIFLYVCSAISFLSCTSVMGAGVYLQRQIARNESVNFNYISSVVVFLALSSGVALIILPKQLMILKLYLILIIVCNAITNFLIAICNGRGRYDTRYQILLVSCCYMVFLIFYMLYHKTHYNLHIIFYSWIVNAIIATVYGIVKVHSFKEKIILKKEPHISISMIFLNLLLIYSVLMPYDFARLYDRFLLHSYFSLHLLGVYTFNCSIMMAAYSLLIIPTVGICITMLSRTLNNIEQQAKIIIRYYFYIVIIFFLVFVSYVPFANEWLNFLGLVKYLSTTTVFVYIFFNMFFYALSVPFIINISLSDDKAQKFFYCCASILTFNLPLLFITIEHTFSNFLNGFILAYFLHFIVCIVFNYSYSLKLWGCLKNEAIKLMKGGRAGVIAFISDVNN